MNKRLFVLTILFITIFTGCCCIKNNGKNGNLSSAPLYNGKIDRLSPFGVFCDSESKNGRLNLDSAVELGSKKGRLILRWDFVEPKKGKFNFTLPDRVIDMHLQAGISLLITVDCISPWGTRTRVNNIKNFTASPPLNIIDYENFLKTVVSRYKGKVQYWQIGNEIFDNRLLPPVFWDGTKEEYIELLIHSYKTIKKADPEAKVVMGGFAHELFNKILYNKPPGLVEQKKVRDFFEYLIDKGNKYCDAVDFHQYYEPDRVYGMLNLLKETMKKYGCKKDIINTESGDFDIRLFGEHILYPDKPVPVIAELLEIPGIMDKVKSTMKGGVQRQEFTDFANFLKKNERARIIIERYQSENLLKRISISLSLGVKEIYWASIKDSDTPIDWYWTIMSLCDESGRKKPHFYTYKLTIKKLEHFTKAEEINFTYSVKVIKFTFRDKGPIFVIWNEKDDKKIDFSRQVSTSDVKITHIVTEQNETDKDVKIEIVPTNSIQVNKTPIFLEEVDR
jgi:hypothetical protein